MSSNILLFNIEFKELENEKSKSIGKKLRIYAKYFQELAYEANKIIIEEHKLNTDVNKEKMTAKAKVEKYLKDKLYVEAYSILTGIGKEEGEKCLFDDILTEIKNSLKGLGVSNIEITNRVQQGKVTKIPYIALMNKDVCSRPTETEPYIVIFVSTESKRVYLGFNIGGMDKSKKSNLLRCKIIKSELVNELKRVESKGISSKLYYDDGNELKNNFTSETSNTPSSKYKFTFICYKYYTVERLDKLDNKSFIDDLVSFINIYDKYAANRGKKIIFSDEKM